MEIDKDFEILKKTISRTINFFPERYKQKPLKRRIAVRMRYTKKDSYLEYAHLLENDGEEQRLLHKTLTINVSKFFRNYETFKKIENAVLPKIFDTYKNSGSVVKVWCAGCATGEETYTIAMLIDTFLKEKKLSVPFTVIGTDIDIDSLEKACIGCYRDEVFNEMPEQYIDEYFERNERLCVRHSIKERVHFKRLDLEEDDEELNDLDLVLFRNVLIYMERMFQEKVLLHIYPRLCENGFLVLGKVEMLFGEVKKMFTVLDPRERIYRKCQILTE